MGTGDGVGGGGAEEQQQQLILSDVRCAAQIQLRCQESSCSPPCLLPLSPFLPFLYTPSLSPTRPHPMLTLVTNTPLLLPSPSSSTSLHAQPRGLQHLQVLDVGFKPHRQGQEGCIHNDSGAATQSGRGHATIVQQRRVGGLCDVM